MNYCPGFQKANTKSLEDHTEKIDWISRRLLWIFCTSLHITSVLCTFPFSNFPWLHKNPLSPYHVIPVSSSFTRGNLEDKKEEEIPGEELIAVTQPMSGDRFEVAITDKFHRPGIIEGSQEARTN